MLSYLKVYILKLIYFEVKIENESLISLVGGHELLPNLFHLQALLIHKYINYIFI